MDILLYSILSYPIFDSKRYVSGNISYGFKYLSKKTLPQAESISFNIQAGIIVLKSHRTWKWSKQPSHSKNEEVKLLPQSNWGTLR